MGTKTNPGAHDCYAATEPDEPYFLVRASDPQASTVVRNWAFGRVNLIAGGYKPNTPEQWAKVSEALVCAAEIDAWRLAKLGPQTTDEQKSKMN